MTEQLHKEARLMTEEENKEYDRISEYTNSEKEEEREEWILF